jgi:hypothetical protein
VSDQLPLFDARLKRRRENLGVTLEQPTVARTTNSRGEKTITVKARYIAGRNIDITNVQLTEEGAADLRDLLAMVLDLP